MNQYVYSLRELAPIANFHFYCLLSILVALFLNPQQTKYFGGLAIDFKQFGFFTKYQTAENFVYTFSWLFLSIFFRCSFVLAKKIAHSF